MIALRTLGGRLAIALAGLAFAAAVAYAASLLASPDVGLPAGSFGADAAAAPAPPQPGRTRGRHRHGQRHGSLFSTPARTSAPGPARPRGDDDGSGGDD